MNELDVIGYIRLVLCLPLILVVGVYSGLLYLLGTKKPFTKMETFLGGVIFNEYNND